MRTDPERPGVVGNVTEQTYLDRADRLEQRFAVPVLIAALASVPAVFLTLLDAPWASIGSALNMASGAVLIAETVVLLAVSEDRLAWLRRNKLLVLLAVLIVPAVLFAIGPMQVLRPVVHGLRFAGALRIVRIGRILKAGRLLRERSGLTHGWKRAIAVLATVLSAAFVAVVLADPSSTSRQVLDGTVDRLGVFGALVAGAILAGATYVVATNRSQRSRAEDEDVPQE